ncbi:MAG: DUF3084 domain-containing protein [bacterium]
MLSFGSKIIIMLLAVGGVVAYIGDFLGRSIGRKRLTLFGLRPRYTAITITIITGIMIAMTTLGVLLAISQDARTALFGLEQLKTDLATTQKELNQKIIEKNKMDQELKSAQTDLNKLAQSKNKLQKNVEASRWGELLFKADDIILVSVIQAGPDKEALEFGLQEIILAAEPYSLFVEQDDFKAAVATLSRHTGENIVRLIATSNTVSGEEIPTRIETIDNALIYPAEDEIASLAIPPSLTIPQIELQIKKLLNITHQAAKKAGVIADPSGLVGSIPYSEIFSLSRKIKQYKKGVILKALAREDIYAVGPLNLSFKIFYK